MSIYINGVLFDGNVNSHANYMAVNTTNYYENVNGALTAWRSNTGYGFGEPGPGFLNVTTSGTTGHPLRVSHSRETIEQIVESNIKVLNLSRSSRIVSLYSPKGIAFTVLSLYIAERLGCDLFIESFTGLNYIDRINLLQPTHTLILPNIWKTLNRHPKWDTIDLKNCDTAITGSDFTPSGMLNELRQHGARKVYNVYGSTEVPPIVLVSEEENTYSADSVPDGCEIQIQGDQLACRWSTQKDWWISGDCIDGDLYQFMLKGRKNNMFKQNLVRVYPEQLEKIAVLFGADLALCQQIDNHCVLHYTGSITDISKIKNELSYIPRLRLRQVEEIKLDNNLKKIIRTQSFPIDNITHYK
jgi:phenylacetate-coenzyme A ligase PaaK-like adenylate-forming protein